MANRAVRFERHDTVGEIVLANPPRNLINDAVMDDLRAALDEAYAAVSEGHVRAVLVRADGEVFSAGANVTVFQGLDTHSAELSVARWIGEIRRLGALPVPVVAAVHGQAYGGGFEIALACDLLWAAEDAQLGALERSVGAFPFAGGVQRLAARLGTSRAAEIVFVGRPIPAKRLQELGVVNQLAPAAELLAKARAFVADLASGPTLAFAATKHLLTAYSAGIAAADAVLPALSGAVITSEDLKRGVASLLKEGPWHATFNAR